MKKIISLVLSLMLVLSMAVFAESSEKTTMRIASLKGPTSMGLVQLMNAEDTANNYEFTVEATADAITPALIRGDIDIALVPANLASVLYNKTEGGVQMIAINTLGVLYVIETGDSVHSVEDLRGKTIFSTGQGTTPEFALNYVLAGNGIDPDKDVTIEWKSEAAEVLALLQQDDDAVAMLPQPYVTAAQNQVEGLNIAINLTEAWNELGTESQLITGVMVARTEFLNENKDAVDAFLAEYEASIDYVNANVEDAAQMVEAFDIFKAAIAKKAIPYCNVYYMAGAEMKKAIVPFYQVLFDQNPKALGGKLPDDAFYYEN